MMTFEVPFFENSLKVTASNKGVTEVLWQKRKAKASKNPSPLERRFTRSLEQFLKGQADMDISIDWQNLPGTEFQKQVWKKMWKIPFGKTK